jgi:hypothetical protein
MHRKEQQWADRYRKGESYSAGSSRGPTEVGELITGTGNTGWTNVWRYGDKTNYHMTNLGGTFRTLDNVDGRCELEQGILSQVSATSPSILFRISDPCEH